MYMCRFTHTCTRVFVYASSRICMGMYSTCTYMYISILIQVHTCMYVGYIMSNTYMYVHWVYYVEHIHVCTLLFPVCSGPH